MHWADSEWQCSNCWIWFTGRWCPSSRDCDWRNWEYKVWWLCSMVVYTGVCIADWFTRFCMLLRWNCRVILGFEKYQLFICSDASLIIVKNFTWLFYCTVIFGSYWDVFCEFCVQLLVSSRWLLVASLCIAAVKPDSSKLTRGFVIQHLLMLPVVKVAPIGTT